MTETNQGTITCGFETWVPDMHPEFAPEPIHITCDTEAEAVATWHEPGQDGLERQTEVLCEEHVVEGVRSFLASNWEFVVSSLSADDQRHYRRGYATGASAIVTDRQWTTAIHEGWLETGLASPPHSPELFDMGWERALNERLAVWSKAAEDAEAEL